jgi:hypothetical protein
MEILAETGSMKAERMAPLMKEANELISMIVASLKTSKG